MSDGGHAAVLVMARAPRRGDVHRALESLLGPAGCVALAGTLLTQTLAWAHTITPHVFVAHEPPDAGPDIRLLDATASLFPQNGEGVGARIADAGARVFTQHGGALLIVWPDLPRLSSEHARGALGDIEAGCDVVLGPAINGGLYLLGLARPVPALFELPEQAWRGPDVMRIGLAAVRGSGLDVGILRAERALHRPSDVRALLADPLLDPTLRRVLTPSG